jgi:hypothetical protein
MQRAQIWRGRREATLWTPVLAVVTLKLVSLLIRAVVGGKKFTTWFKKMGRKSK